MFYTLPPVPPPLIHVAITPAQNGARIAALDCKRGSRDCFPTDRVGYQLSQSGVVIAQEDNRA